MMSHKLDAEARSNRASLPKLPPSAPLKLENLDFNFQPPASGGELKMSIESDPVEGLDADLSWSQYQPTEPIERIGIIQNQPTTRPTAPKIYPNNTLVEDLSQCHKNLQPKLVQASRRALRLVSFYWLRPKNKFAKRQTNSRDNSTKLAANQFDAGDQNVKQHYEFKMPHSIMRLNSTLTPDDYNRALCILTRDMRYRLHLLLFSRLQLAWTLIGTVACVLVSLLTFTTATVLTMAVVWSVLQAVGFVACKRMRKLLDRMLERSVAQANTFLMDHKLMLGVINIGGLLSQSRFVVPMLYFDSVQCIEQIDSNIKRDLVAMRNVDRDEEQNRSQLSSLETNQNVLVRSQLAKKIVLDFSQRWVLHFDRSKLLLNDDSSIPRHLSTGKCLCQFIEETLENNDKLDGQANKPQTESLGTSRQSIDSIEEANDTRIDIWNGELKKDSAQSVNASSMRVLMSANLACGYSELNVFDLMEVSKKLESKTANKSKEIGEHGSETPSKLVECSANPLKQERAESRSSTKSELSFDLLSDDQSQDRNETLFRSLKLLFELRANELSRSPYEKSAIATNNWAKISPSNMTLPEQERDRQMVNAEISDIPDDRAEKRTSSGGKFFAQFDGLFSMGPKRGQREGFYASSSRQMLDIS